MVRYQPLRNNQFKSLTWGTEVLYSRNRYSVTAPDGTRITQHQCPLCGHVLIYRLPVPSGVDRRI